MTNQEIITKIEDSEILRKLDNLKTTLRQFTESKLIDSDIRDDVTEDLNRLGDTIGDIWNLTNEGE